jgi:uncharacterized RDD family membrane protein YckC
MSQVVTGEAVVLDLRVARVPSRLVAAVIDFAAKFAVVSLLTGIVTAAGGSQFDPAFAIALVVTLYLVVFLAYPVVSEAVFNGKTLGKLAMGLRVVRDDGGPVRVRHALTRNLLGLFVEAPGVTLGGAAIVTSLLSDSGKRLGDLLAGTLVIHDRVPGQAMPAPMMPWGLVEWAQALDLSAVDDSLALSLRQFFFRVHELRPEARDRLGDSIFTEITRRTSPPPPADAPRGAVLAAVLAERRRREQVRLGALAAQRAGPPLPPGWSPPPPTPGWPEARPDWSTSAPSTGQPPFVGPPPSTGQPTGYGPPPAVPPGPQPQWGPAPVAPDAPAADPKPPDASPQPADAEAPAAPFALPS